MKKGVNLLFATILNLERSRVRVISFYKILLNPPLKKGGSSQESKIPRNYNKIEKVFDKSSEMIYNFCELFINNNSE